MIKEGKNKGKHKSVATRILRLCGLTSLIACLLVGITSVIVTGTELQKIVSTQMTTLAEQVGHEVEQSIEAKYAYLNGIATNEVISSRATDKVTQKRMLSALVGSDEDIVDIGFIDTTGQSLAKDLYTMDDFSAEAFFTEAIAGNNYVSDPFDYESAPNKMVFVFSVPVYKNGSGSEIVGVLYQMVDAEYFSKLVSSISFGKTGFVYMIDSEATNLAHYDNEKVLTRENAIKQFDDKAEFESLISFLKKVISEESGYSTYSYNGSTRVGGYSTCTNRNWHVVVLAEQKEIFRGQNVSFNYTVIIVIAVQIIGIVSTLLLVRKIFGPLRKLREINLHMSEGNLTDNLEVQPENKLRDEIGEMVDSTDQFKEKLKEVIVETKNSSTTLFDISVSLNDLATQSEYAAENVCKAIEDVSQSTVHQAMEVESAASDVGTLAEAIDSIKDDVESLMTLAESAMEAERISKEALCDLITSNGRTTLAFEEISEQIKETDKATQRISEAANLITAIASQTNLLSLNASIEAARAGEAGKGFAVVATEIQQLSEQSDNAASTIQEIIKQLTDGSAKSIKKMDEALVLIKEQEVRLQKTEEESGMVDEDVEEMEGSAIQIRRSVDSCEEVKNNVNRIVTNLSAISQENAASAEETNAAMEELNANIGIISQTATNLAELSDELKKYMSFWTV